MQPTNGGSVVPEGEDTCMFLPLGLGATLTLEPNIYDHPQELQEIVDSRVTANDAPVWDSDSPPSASREAVSPDTEWACVGPADASGFSDRDQVDGHSDVSFTEEGLP